jgi:exonuclease SbcC
MIPLKLQIKNFLSYGADLQIIDFSGYPLICLSGKNGHGKSALLDALTWALWGQARKISGVAKADQGLVRLGQTQMMVCLDFVFADTHYRVRREFALTYGKPHAALDFAIIDEDTDTTVSLTDKTIRDTQQKIDDLLRLDYDSFVNSAFLRQGQANEFSKKSPKERKEVLAGILGLNQYEEVRKRALEKARTLTLEKSNVELLQTKNETELLKTDDLKKRLLELHAALVQCTQQEKELAAARSVSLNDRKALLNEQKNYEVIHIQHDQLIIQEKKQLDALRSLVATWRTINKKQSALASHAHLEHEKKKLIDKISEYQRQLQQTLELKEKALKEKEALHALEKVAQDKLSHALQQQQLIIERTLFAHTTTLSALQDAHKKRLALDLEKQITIKEITHFDAAVKEQAAHSEQYKKNEQQFEKRKSFYQKYIALGSTATAELENIAHKQQLSQDEHNPSCPLCEQNLSAARRKFLKNQLAIQEALIIHRINRLKKIVTSLKIVLIEQHNVIAQQKKNSECIAISLVKIDELTKTATKIDTQSVELDLVVTQHTATEKQLSHELAAARRNKALIEQNGTKDLYNDTAYIEKKAHLAALEQEALTLAYDQKAHQQALTELQRIEAVALEYAQLLEQINKQQERMNNVHQLCLTLKEIKHQKNSLQNELKAFAYLPTALHNLTEQEKKVSDQAHILTTQKERLLIEKGSCEHEQEKLAALEIDHKQQKITINKLQETIDEYQVIAAATGKDGIQALLIEDAIPEIEHEANNLLSKLSNNQAQIFIESLRDLKKGGTKETLDIKISDTAGIRPYEMFSGGEAFRIDFALRIAISKLLARRAGTSLQTLIIDEGFGSQDEEGLTNIMDSIYKIQDDFAKIIIVSHLATMKEQFPVHFVIEKGPHGSGVKVIEHG